MKLINNIKPLVLLLLSMALLGACTGDLDRFPENDTTGDIVYSTYDGYKGAAVKVYAAYALTGNQGPDGKPDISGLDEGQFADFLRMFFNHQELPTDEAHTIWQDPGIPGLNNLNFSSENPFTRGIYNRSITQIMYANEFLRNSTDEILGGKSFAANEIEDIKYFRAEARFIRAFQYWVLMDLFGNPPFVTEESELNILPEQINRADLFKYVESELKEIADGGLLREPRTNEYGRADKAAAWALLARVYLNAEVYTGTARYDDAVTYAEKVINAGYSLKNDYQQLFLADNNLNNPEVILSINYDGRYTRGNGGTTFLINCGAHDAYQKEYADILLHYGIRDNPTWGGYRTRYEYSERWEDNDKRRLFIGEEPSISDPIKYDQGLMTYKWRNIKIDQNGNWDYGSDTRYADNDFPLFRLAEMYLVYAEAVKRGGNGSSANALDYLNRVRERGFGNSDHNYKAFNNVELEDILNERGRELYWECHRRTDLIRFGMFTGSRYVWEWKGGVRTGRSVSSHFNLYPLPSSDLMANSNLKQNPNY